MNTNYSENNHLILVGKVVSDKKYSHEIYGEKFYVFNMEVVRLSSTTDIIPITISERLLTDIDLSIGKKLSVEGQFRSYNNYENEKNRLILTVFAKEIAEVEENEEEKNEVTNEVVLIGYVCKKPIYRQTPFGREIADVLLAVNRAYNKSDYIPSIAWGRNARFCQNIEVGTEVKITLPFEIVEDLKNEEQEQKNVNNYIDLADSTILVAEDNVVNMQIITELLALRKIKVLQAWNGDEAVNIFKTSKEYSIDAVLMDILMPVLDGLEAAKLIRQMDREDAKTIPIIALSANIFDEDIKESRAAG